MHRINISRVSFQVNTPNGDAKPCATISNIFQEFWPEHELGPSEPVEYNNISDGYGLKAPSRLLKASCDLIEGQYGTKRSPIITGRWSADASPCGSYRTFMPTIYWNRPLSIDGDSRCLVIHARACKARYGSEELTWGPVDCHDAESGTADSSCTAPRTGTRAGDIISRPIFQENFSELAKMCKVLFCRWPCDVFRKA